MIIREQLSKIRLRIIQPVLTFDSFIEYKLIESSA